MNRRSAFPSWPLFIAAFFVLVAGGGLLYLLLTHEEPSNGGSYTEGIAGSPMHLNPILASFNETDEDLTSLVFSGLTKLGPQGAVQPDLAESWAVSADGKAYTFTLQEGAVWQDGKPVTPDDVLFTVAQLQDKDFQGSPEIAAVWRPVKASKVDERTVQFTLDQAFSPFLTYTSIGVIAKHRFEGVSAKDMAGPNANQSPIGTGPFQLKEATLDRVVLEPNLKSYQGRPKLGQLQFIFMRDDQTLAAALNTNQVQGGLLRPSVGKDAVDSVKSNGRLQMFSIPRANYTILFLNSQSPFFKDKAVRQAVAYSIDRNTIIRDVTGGLAVPAGGPISVNSWAYNEAAPWYPYNPEKAAQMLDQAGWKLNSSSGIREKDGQQFKFTLYTNDDALRVATGQELAKEFKRVGLLGDFASSGTSGLMQNFLLPRKYDSIVYGIDPGTDPDPYPLWHSSQAASDGLNVASVASPQFDTLLEKGRVSTNPAERLEIYNQFQALFEEEVPSIPLYHPLYSYAIDRSVKGVQVQGLFDPSTRFLSVRNWYTQTQRVWGR